MAHKYGAHADDQWSIDELLRAARAAATEQPSAGLGQRRDPSVA